MRRECVLESTVSVPPIPSRIIRPGINSLSDSREGWSFDAARRGTAAHTSVGVVRLQGPEVRRVYASDGADVEKKGLRQPRFRDEGSGVVAYGCGERLAAGEGGWG